MIISITNLKGGVGKSTMTQNLAVCFAQKGAKVCIADTDKKQHTSIKWSGQREEDRISIPVFGVTEGEALVKNVKALQKEYDHVFIDGTPILEELASWTVLASDLVIIPTLPSPSDIWSRQEFKIRLDQIKAMGTNIPAYLLINKHAANRNLDKEINTAVNDFGMGLLNTKIRDRVAYKEAMLEGLGVVEYKDKKAKEELEALADEILKIISKL